MTRNRDQSSAQVPRTPILTHTWSPRNVFAGGLRSEGVAHHGSAETPTGIAADLKPASC